MHSLYDHALDFATNYKEGPFFNGPIPERIIIPKEQWKTIWGYPVMSTVGISACPLTVESKGVCLMSDLGYDIITAKTIRSKRSYAHPFPNVSYIKERTITDINQVVTAVQTPTDFVGSICSIGKACYELEQSFSEFKKGLAHLKEGQILISSIYGVGETTQEIANDFVYLARQVASVGVHAVELNLSCPNVDGYLHKDPEKVTMICAAVVHAVAPLPVVIKIGLFDSDEQMEQVILCAARAGIRGIAGINAIGMRVQDEQGNPYFGTRKKAGVSGDPVRPHALVLLKKIKELISKNNFNITLLGGGGITKPSHIDTFFDAGVDTAMMAAGATYNPYLAHEYHIQQGHKNETASSIITPSSL